MAAGPPAAPVSPKCSPHNWSGWPKQLRRCQPYIIRYHFGHFSMRGGVAQCRRPVPLPLGFCHHGYNNTDGVCVCARTHKSVCNQHTHTNKCLLCAIPQACIPLSYAAQISTTPNSDLANVRVSLSNLDQHVRRRNVQFLSLCVSPVVCKRKTSRVFLCACLISWAAVIIIGACMCK